MVCSFLMAPETHFWLACLWMYVRVRNGTQGPHVPLSYIPGHRAGSFHPVSSHGWLCYDFGQMTDSPPPPHSHPPTPVASIALKAPVCLYVKWDRHALGLPRVLGPSLSFLTRGTWRPPALAHRNLVHVMGFLAFLYACMCAYISMFGCFDKK